MKEDPKFRQEEIRRNRGDLIKYIKNQSALRMQNAPKVISEFKRLEDTYNIEFDDKFYKYIKFYDEFQKKYSKKWAQVWENLIKWTDSDVEFSYVFPAPNYKMAENDLYWYSNNHDRYPISIAGDWNNSDHSYLTILIINHIVLS